MALTRRCANIRTFSRLHAVQFAVINNEQLRPYSSEPTILTDLKRGTGGRSSFSGTVATVFGASGILGKHIVSKLGRTGAQIIIPYRGDPYAVKDLKLCGDLGQILFLPFNLRDEESMRKAMRHSNVVINCMGQRTSTKLDFLFDECHIEGAERVARISKELNVNRIIHVSALSQTSELLRPSDPDLSGFMNTKAEGEKLVRMHREDATIFRPAQMWAMTDYFLQYLASRERRNTVGNLIRVYLKDKGITTVKQPVFYGDVAEGVVRSIASPLSLGEVYEAVGPHRYRIDDLVKWIYFIMRYLPSEIKIVDSVFWRRITERKVPAELLFQDELTDKLTGCPTLDDLGVPLTKIEDRIHHILYWHRRYREYWDAVGEFPAPPNPPIQNT